VHRRFQPIVTDFSRTTQLIVRYRLDDVLRIAKGPCPCGRPTLSLGAIEGRADDVLWAARAHGDLSPIFPDVLRHAFARADPPGAVRDYRLEQHGEIWRIRLDVPAAAAEGAEIAVRGEIASLMHRLGVQLPDLRFEPWRDEPLHLKRRRIRCERKPLEAS
jgi:phenylacetate-coenzyme A ligase PaaK-like adenylate-forming protein